MDAVTLASNSLVSCYVCTAHNRTPMQQWIFLSQWLQRWSPRWPCCLRCVKQINCCSDILLVLSANFLLYHRMAGISMVLTGLDLCPLMVMAQSQYWSSVQNLPLHVCLKHSINSWRVEKVVKFCNIHCCQRCATNFIYTSKLECKAVTQPIKVLPIIIVLWLEDEPKGVQIEEHRLCMDIKSD